MRLIAMLLASVLLLPAAVRAAPTQQLTAGPPRDLAFDLFREGNHIGTHTITFHKEGDRLRVDIDIELAVKVLFVTAYRYVHHNQETWRNGRLIAIATRTDDDGEKAAVDATAEGDALLVEASTGKNTLPAGVIPTSYWNPATLRQQTLLNTQTGKLMNVRIVDLGADRIYADGQMIPARHYRMDGDLRLELWYDDAERLARVRFKAENDGSVIDYVRRSRPDEPVKSLPEVRRAGG